LGSGTSFHSEEKWRTDQGSQTLSVMVSKVKSWMMGGNSSAPALSQKSFPRME